MLGNARIQADIGKNAYMEIRQMALLSMRLEEYARDTIRIV